MIQVPHSACQPREVVAALLPFSTRKPIFTPRPSRCAYIVAAI
ncbi:hypothetical protein ACLB1T_00505 [Escherichia coli]